MAPPFSKTRYTTQYMQNWGFDDVFKVPSVESLVYNPSTNNLERLIQPTILYGTIAQSGAGTTELVAAQAAGIKIKVISYVFTLSLDGTVKFTGTADLTGAMNILASGGAVVLGQPSSPLFETAAATALSIVTTGGAAKGHFSYIVGI